MECNYKTLVLVDNSLSVEKGNQEIIKATLTYLFEHADEEDAFALAVFGETVYYAEDYGINRQSLIKAVNELTFTDQDTYLADALMGILQDWQQADFACRSIILVTDGLSEKSFTYAEEELYFTLDKADYPVYVIGCVQENNREAMKTLSAVARISGGQIFFTEFEDSEAEVERKIGDELLEAMRENRTVQEEMKEEAKKETETTEPAEEEDLAVEFQETAISENEILLCENEEAEPVIYELNSASETFAGRNAGYGGILFGVVIVLTALFAAGCMLIKKNRMRKASEKEFIEGLQTEVRRRSSYLTGGEENCGVTQALFRDETGLEDGNATRLLFQQSELHDIILEDRSDPTKLFRASCGDKLILGRGKNVCDIIIDYDNSVSGRHCELYLRGERWFVRDLQSSNGTKVNDEKVYQEMELHTGDILKVGRLEFQVRVQA